MLGQDEPLITKLKSAGDSEIDALLDKLHPHVNVIEDRQHYDIHQKGKVRLINPTVLHQNSLLPASTLSEKVKRMGDAAYEKASSGMYVRIIPTDT